jgi:monofunctional glycosyltransferase
MARSRPRSRWAFRLLLAALVAIALWAAWEAVTWPDVARLAREQPKTTAFIDEYRARQRVLGTPARVAWKWTPYAAISPDIKRAVLVAEDINFFSHRGFELAELQNALEEALRDRELPRGASTISQQLAKNLWLSPSRNPWRKAKEAMLTWQMERALSKRRILECYLNVVEFGPGVYGVEAASRRYFGKPAADVNADEAAQLAASLPRPRAWHPGVTTTAYRRYVDNIRRRMDRAEFPGRLLQ